MFQKITFFLAIVFACAAQGEEEDPFPTRPSDTVVLKNGTEHQGRILSEDSASIRIRIGRSKTVFPLQKSDIKTIKRRATPEEAVKLKFEENKNNPTQIARLARQALDRFKGNKSIIEIVLKTLEVKAKSSDSALLELLCELFLEKGEFEKAEGLAKSVVAKKESATAHLLLGRSHAGLGKFESALVSLRKAHGLDPKREDILVELAVTLLRSGDAKAANKVFSDALASNPRQLGALVGQGDVWLRQGIIKDAIDSYNKALEVDSRNLSAMIGLASCRLLRGEYEEADQMADRILNADIKNAQAYGIQGYSALYKGQASQPEDALNKIEESLGENATDPRVLLLKAQALNRHAEVLEATDKPDEARLKRTEAERLLKDIEAGDSNDSYLQYLMAYLRYVQSETAAAGEARQQALALAAKGFKRAAQLAPSYAPAHKAVGAIAQKMRKYPEAKMAFETAIQHDPGNDEYHAARGLALLGMAQTQTALSDFKKAIEINDKNVDALVGLGYIANFEKNELSAREFFQKALAIDGTRAYAAKALGLLYAQRGLKLEYLTFSEGDPPGWRGSKDQTVSSKVENGKVRWRGTIAGSAFKNLQYGTTIPANMFRSIEADLEIPPECPGSLVLRIASGKGSAVSFYIEFGKDDAGRLAYRYKDYSGLPPDWNVVEPWPKSGKVRVSLESEDLDSGVVSLLVNGKNRGGLPLQLRKPSKIDVGFALSIAARETVDASADNVALLLQGNDDDSSEQRPGQLIPPEEIKGK